MRDYLKRNKAYTNKMQVICNYRPDFKEIDRLLEISTKELERSEMKMKDKNGKQLKERHIVRFKGEKGTLTFGSILGVSTWFVKTDKEEVPLCNINPEDIEIVGEYA